MKNISFVHAAIEYVFTYFSWGYFYFGAGYFCYDKFNTNHGHMRHFQPIASLSSLAG